MLIFLVAAALLGLMAHSCQALNGCLMEGQCQGNPTAISFQQTLVDCWSECKLDPYCNYYSFTRERRECYIYSTCEATVYNAETEWVSNNVECIIPNGKFTLSVKLGRNQKSTFFIF